MFTAIISRTLRPIIELEQKQPKLGTSSALPWKILYHEKPRRYRPYLNGQGEPTCKYSEQSRLIENLADHQTTTTTAASKGNQSNLEAATRLTSCLKIRAISSPVPIGIRNTDQIPSEYNDETTLINHHSLLAICDTEGVEGSKRLTSESSKSHSAFTARSALLAQSSPLCASCPAPCGNGDCECENASHVANTPDTKSEGDTSVTSPTAIQKPTSKTATIRLRDSKVTNRKDLTRQKPSPVDKTSLAHAIGTDSIQGSRYFVTFIDVWSRHCSVYFLQRKSDVTEAWRLYLAWATQLGYVVDSILTDNGGEYFSSRTLSGEILIDEESLSAFEDVCKTNATGKVISHTKTPGPNHSDMNPIAERYNRKIMDIANAQLYHAKLGTMFWEYSVRHAVYLINRIPLKFHAKYHSSTPGHTLVNRKKSSFSRVKVWGCDMTARVSDGPLSSEPGFPNGQLLLHMGITNDEKGWIGYDPESSTTGHNIRHVFDVAFDEDMRNRTNNLRAYDKRRKSNEHKPVQYNEWDDVDDNNDHNRSLYDTYESTITDGESDSPEGYQPTSENETDSITDDQEVRGEENTEQDRLKFPDTSNDDESDTNESIDYDSDDEPEEDRYLSDAEEDDYDAKPDSTRTNKPWTRQDRLHESMPSTFKKSLPNARKFGPLTEERIQSIRDKDELEPSALIRPTRFHKAGVYDSKRPKHLLDADKTFIKAAFEHNYKIRVSQTHNKREGTLSALRFNLVKPARTASEYIALATAQMTGKDKQTISKAISKALADFRYEYDRGLIKFPDRESDHHAHYCNAEKLAKHYQVERVADLISQNQTNYYANIATQSFNQLVSEIYQVQDAIEWIETKERLDQYGRRALEAFLTRAPADLSAHLTTEGLEPNNLDPSTHLTPNHYGGAKKSKDREHWEEAMDEELTNCRNMGTWDLVPQSALPPNSELVDCRWVYKIKTNSAGEISRWRARIVARGYSQRPGIDYNEEEVYAPVVSYDTLRTCLSIATATDYDQTDPSNSSEGGKIRRGLEIKQADIVNAYLIGTLDSPIYMRQPPSARMEFDSSGRPLIAKLNRPLYGLKQSGHIFANVLHTFLCDELGMNRLISDKCAFLKDGTPSEWDTQTKDTPKHAQTNKLDVNGTQLVVLTYVDDLTVLGSKSQCAWIMDKLRKRFKIQEKETGDIEFLLSMKISRNREDGTLTLNQDQAIDKIANKLGIFEKKPSVKTAMKVTPMTKLTEPEKDPAVVSWPYLETVGSLLHISQCTRPDIAYAVGSLARHSTTLGKEHIKAAKRCVQYLYNTRELCIKYSADHLTNEPLVFEAGRSPIESKPTETEPQAYADADYAMDITTRKSTSGGIIFLNGGPITWSSKLQKIIAQSTAEAEIIAATEITKEIVHLRLLLSELGARKDQSVCIHEDNQACILMGNNMKSSRSAKHYEIRLHFLQESIRSNVIKFKYCPTDEMIADALTKPLDDVKFKYFREKMLSEPIQTGAN